MPRRGSEGTRLSLAGTSTEHAQKGSHLSSVWSTPTSPPTALLLTAWLKAPSHASFPMAGHGMRVAEKICNLISHGPHSTDLVSLELQGSFRRAYMCKLSHFHAQLYPTLCHPVDCSPRNSSAHGIFSGKNSGMSCHALFQAILKRFTIRTQEPGMWQGHFSPPNPPTHILTFIHLKCLLITHSALDTVLGTGDPAMDRIVKVLFALELKLIPVF